MPTISTENTITLPAECLTSAGLRPGDEVTVDVVGAGTIVLRRVGRDLDHAFGVFDGRYEPGYLDRLRRGERA